MPERYYRFLNLLQAIKDLPTLPALDPVEERLLNGLATLWAGGGEVTVLQAMNSATDASPSTVHRRLKTLRMKGLITMVERPGDQRIKCVKPTRLGLEYFAAVGRCMDEAMRS